MLQYYFGRPAAGVRGAAVGRMPAADGRTLEFTQGRPGPRLRRGPGRIDFQSDTSGHPPGAQQRAAAAPQPSFRDDGARSRRLFLTALQQA